MKLYSQILGQGNPIIILHGLYGSSDNWHSIGKALANAGFSVHMLDMRNHGRSPHSAEHNYTLMCEDVKEYFDTHAIQKAILLGHSMGGKTAMLFTLSHPEQVEKLIIADIAPKYYPMNYDNHLHILGAMHSLDLKSLKTRRDIEKKLAPQIKNKDVVQLIMKNLHRSKNKEFEWKINIDSLTKNLKNITGGTEGWDKKQSLTPALFLRGEHSHYLSLEDDFLIKKSFEHSEITTVPNAGHWLHAEQPELVIKTILYFIQ